MAVVIKITKRQLAAGVHAQQEAGGLLGGEVEPDETYFADKNIINHLRASLTPPPRTTSKDFGMGRRMPIAARYGEE
jgi:hypothetical protein